MYMPKAHLVQIYEHLFTEGVLVAERDLFLPKHPELTKIPNLHVVKAMQSLKSRNYVEQNFAWRHYYWRLTNDGIQYLRDFLHLPAEIVPATLKKQQPRAAPAAAGGRPGGDARREYGGGRGGDRDSYRRAPTAGGDKAADAGAGAASMEFRGMGRGKKPQ
ncbi:Plectin/S10 N-terminal [Trinorchestia longiramus]|nr:Plectin/S10 N-terminal [Trinorchestia longiramus]